MKAAKGEVNWVNRTLYHGDNLIFMRKMNSGTIDLIATDPPFNKGRDFHATPNSLAKNASFQDRWNWKEDIHQDWVDRIKDEHPQLMEAIESARHAHSDAMGAYTCFLSVRLLEMYRLLKPTGALFLHCDPTASHYIRACLDSIFKHNNYRNEIIWHHPKIGVASQKFTSNTDTIFFYTKSDKYTFNPQKLDEPNQLYNRWKRKIRCGILYYREAKTINDSPAKSKIRQREKELRRPLVDEDIVVDFNDPKNWKVVDNVWKHSFLRGNSKESCGFPTQKPLPIYERIIEAASNKNDWVLDPFAGCATTCVAAERKERQWVGIDIWAGAIDVIQERVRRECKRMLDEDITFTDEPPERTDGREEESPIFDVPEKIIEPPGPKMSRAEMMETLIRRNGIVCAGCDREFPRSEYLQLDHNTPRADAGINHISNRILLCPPCNLRKSHRLTLSGLRERNRREGFMADQDPIKSF